MFSQRIKLLFKFLFLYPLNLRKPMEPSSGCPQCGSLPYLTHWGSAIFSNGEGEKRNPEGHGGGERTGSGLREILAGWGVELSKIK